MTCATCGAIVDTTAPTCQLCGTSVPAATVSEAAPEAAPAAAAGAAAVTGAAPEAAPAAAAATGAVSGAAPDAAPDAAAAEAAMAEATAAGAAAGWVGGGAGGAGGPTPPPPAGGAPAWSTPQPHPSGLGSDLRGWAIAAHLGGLIIGLSTAAVFGFVGPLLVWLFKRDEHAFTDHHAKEAMNFQLTVLLVLVLSVVLAVPALIFGVLTLGIGLVILGILAVVAAVAWIVLPILGAVKASNGEGFRYPLTIRFIS